MKKIKKSDGLLNTFYTFAIQICIMIEEDMIIPKLFQIMLLILKYGYLLSFIVMPAYLSAEVDDNVFNVFYQVTSFCRHIYYLDAIISGNNLTCYGYLIVLFLQLIIAVYYSVSFYLYMKEKKNQKSLSLSDYLIKQKSFMRMLMNFSAFYGQIVGVYLYLLLYELSLNSLFYSLKQLGQGSNLISYVNCVFSLMVIIGFLICFFFRFLVAEEALTINPNNFKKLDLTTTALFCVFLKILLISLNTAIDDQMTKFYLNFFILTLLVCFQVKNQFSNFSTVNQDIVEIKFASFALIQSTVIILLIFKSSGLAYGQKFSVLVLLTQQLVYRIISTLWSQRVTELSMKNPVNKHPKYIQYLISLKISDDENKRQDLQVLDYLLHNKHKAQCVNSHCRCRKDINYEEMMKIQTQESATNFNRSLFLFKNDLQMNSFYLHYVSLLTLIGHTSLAFQQSNILLYSQKKSQPFLQQNLAKADPALGKGVQTSVQSFTQMGSIKSQPRSIGETKNNFITLKSSKLSFIERMKLQILQDQIKTNMNQKFLVNTSKQSINSEDLSHSVNLFLSSELNNDLIKQKVIKAFSRKVAFLQTLNKAIKIQSNELFNNCKNVAQKLYDLEVNLNNLYKQFPSQKIQSVNAFFQAELMNDFFVAYRLANVTTISDEKLLKMHQNMQINLISSNVIYMLVGFQENSSNLNILSHSNSVHKFFGYKFDKFNQITTIDKLIPKGIKQIHELLVKQFMIEGQSKFFREINQNLVQMENSYVKAVDFFFDINFSNQNDMTFAVFFIEKSNNNNSYLVVNSKYNVTNISMNFYQMLGFKTIIKKKTDAASPTISSRRKTLTERKRKNLTRKLPDKSEMFQLIDVQIDYMLPDFQSMISQKTNQSTTDYKNESSKELQRFYGEDFYFLKQAVMDEIFSKALTNEELIKMLKHSWADVNNLIVYAANLTINCKSIQDHTYITIEIEDLKVFKDNQAKLTQYQSIRTRVIQIEDKGENLKISGKNSEVNLSQQSYKSEVLVIANDEVVANDWSQYFDISQFKIEDEEQVNVPKQMENDDVLSKISQQLMGNMVDEQEKNIVMKNLDEDFMTQSQKTKAQQFFQASSELLSPSGSVKNFLIPIPQNIDLTKINSSQQKFYVYDMEQEAESIEEDSSIQGGLKNEIQQDPHNNNKSQNQDIRDYIMMQLQMDRKEDVQVVMIDDGASQVSSLAGFRKSKFLKKYETLNKVLQSTKNPGQFAVSMALMVLMIVLCTLYTCIVLTNTKTDMNRFLKEIDMLELKANIMGPAYKFTLSQYAFIGYYADALYYKTISIGQGKNLSSFAIFNINNTYNALKINFDKQLTNPYLEEFFTDQYITVAQFVGGKQGLQYRNITFRESILTWLGLLHDFTVLVDFKKFVIVIDPNATFIIYSYANYGVFIQHFDQIENSIFQSTNQRTYNVQNKWNTTVIPFIVINFIIILLTFYVYNLYLHHYERILNIFRLIDPVALQKDLDRYGIILELLHKDSNIMFKYQFDLDTKEQFLMKEDLKKETFQQRNLQTKKKDKTLNLPLFRIPSYKGLIVLLILYGVFIGYGFLVLNLTTDYLVSYLPTAQFYRGLADMTVSLCAVYAQREILYTAVYSFYENNQVFKDDIRAKINQNLLVVQEFEQFLSMFQGQANQYLIKEQFKKDFTYYTTNDICQALTNDYYQQAQLFCNVSMNAVTKRGLLPTLNYMSTALVYERDLNNFTARALFPFEELEVPLITSQVLTQFMDELKDGFYGITQDLIQTMNLISMFFLVYLLLKLVVISTVVRMFYEREFFIVKRFLLLIPQQTIFLEVHYERALRLMIVQDNLV